MSKYFALFVVVSFFKLSIKILCKKVSFCCSSENFYKMEVMSKILQHGKQCIPKKELPEELTVLKHYWQKEDKTEYCIYC